MKIQNNTNNNIPKMENSSCSPAFRSGASGLLSASGTLMQGIENQGFWLTFLIQDCIGMTCPRTVAGFLRDKDVTGKYNKQEGFEVLGREGMTGPIMMAIAPLGLLAAAKFGRSTSVNTQLIKRFGKSLKNIVSQPDFDKNLLKSPEKFKQEFYKVNIERILNSTVGKENTTKESIDYILKELEKYENIPVGTKLSKFMGKSKYKSERLKNITDHINNIKYKTSSDLDMLQKISFEEKNFNTKDAFDAMVKYTDDAIVVNKRLEHLGELEAESIMHKSLAKRVITNVSLILTTLGVLSVLPRIYARSNTAPAARALNENNKENNIESLKDERKNQKNKINFKGKEKTDLLEKLGKKIANNKSDFISSELEYNGHNFTNTLMAGLSVFGLITPRGMRAYSRAKKDENGRKDLTELYEIFLRDITSSLAVVFAVPMLTRAAVTSYENTSGFILMQKDRSKNKFITALDLINPYSKAHVLTNAEINALYGEINSKEKMLNFCKYIDKNGGDLQKILSKSEHHAKVFNESTKSLASLKGLSKKEKNKQIIEIFEKFSKPESLIKDLMKNSGKSCANVAKGFNSIPAVLAMFCISPYILGWVIPRLTYKNTRRIHEKQDEERVSKINTAA